MDPYTFTIACAEGRLERVKYLVELKADITANDNQALVFASQNGHLEVVKYLLTGEPGNKADITARNNNPVLLASLFGRLEVVKFLLSKGADFSRLTPKHKTYFRTLKVIRRWRFFVFLRKLFQIALPLYFSPGFPGYFRGRKSLENFLEPILNPEFLLKK